MLSQHAVSKLFLFITVLLVLSLKNSFAFNIIPKIPSFLSSNHVHETVKTGRKTLGNILIGGALLGLTPVLTPDHSPFVQAAYAADSVFVGSYNDPNHPGCLRKITAKGKEITIVGSDNIDGSNQWIIKAKEEYPGTIFVDFSPKGGPADLLGVFDEKDNGIRWPDKNLWSKLK